jgi:hypothetical protein
VSLRLSMRGWKTPPIGIDGGVELDSRDILVPIDLCLIDLMDSLVLSPEFIEGSNGLSWAGSNG